MTRKLFSVVVLLLLTPLAGCAGLWPDHDSSRREASSSLVDFLYPQGVRPPDALSPTRLELPLRVGLGFLPDARSSSALTEAHRQELLEHIRAHFEQRPYVEDIVIVPQTYLSGRDGALVVEQLGRLYNLDVVGLVSWDQVTASDARKSSFLYWTILGAYVVKGNLSTVSTFTDLAVIDVRSKKLLLRAGGAHHDQKNSTLVELSAARRNNQVNGFDQAARDLITNFAHELDGFETVITSDSDIEVVHRGVRGTGSLLPELLLLLGIWMARCRRASRAM